MEEQPQPPIYRTVAQFSEKHRAFSPPSLRHLIFKSHPRQSSKGEIKGNGLDKAIVRVGRKILIDEARFFEWLAEQSTQGSE